MSADLVTIRTFINAVDAELRADDCGGTRPHLWLGGVEVVVREADLERAEEVLTIEPRPLDRFPGDPSQ